jgi:2-keto-3-deoxy-L-rhamnonate aldolase RhmA
VNAPWPASALAVGTFVKLPTPEVIEVLALSGLDFVVIDNEHASIGPQVVSTMIAVARGCGIDAFVRVAGLTAGDVQPPLDAGANGLFLPRVDDVAAAHAAVGACRFPPLGHRGASPSGRAGGWGTDDLATYVARGASDVTLVAQLESVAALRSAAGIAAVPGIDALFVGPADLAVSAGRTLDDPVLQGHLEDARTAARRSGTPLGTTAPPATPGGPVDPRGLRFLTLSTDAGLLAAGARGAVRSAVAEPAEGVPA